MNNTTAENGVIDISKYRRKLNLINKGSYLEFLEKMVEDTDEDLTVSRVKYFFDFFNAGHSVSLEQLDKQNNWFLDRYIIAVLETEQIILRVPATDRYIKSSFAKEPIGNFILTPNTTTREGYLALSKIEAEMVHFEIFHPSNENLFSLEANKDNVVTGRKFTISDYPKIECQESSIDDEESVLIFLNENGVVSYLNIIQSLGKERGNKILELLESKKLIMRISGTMLYIRFISSGIKNLKFKFEMMSCGLNELGINALLKAEARCFVSLLLILTEADSRAGLYLNISLAMIEEKVFSL